MWETIVNFFTAVPFWELLLIFVAKIVEVTMGTMRIILISKGYRKQGTALAIVEILLWVFIASSVIKGVSDTPIKGIVYAIGFALGVYVGSFIENRLAVGKVLIQVISDKVGADIIVNILRVNGHGVTSIDAYGKDSERTVLMIFANRKNKQVILDLIKDADEKALVVANEVSIVSGGFVSPWRKLAK
ncbi:MAG: DUF5698 domain-containing protein [Acholeplasmataceae bacterium]|nr:DUF5698 domain-containing protein [Acholeplasmataceae bacterium]